MKITLLNGYKTFAKKPKIKNYKNFEIIKNKSNIEKEILALIWC